MLWSNFWKVIASVKKVVFLHIRKTAGTSLNEVIKSNFKATDIAAEGVDPANNDYKYYHGHYQWSQISNLEANVKIITMFREPKD